MIKRFINCIWNCTFFSKVALTNHPFVGIGLFVTYRCTFLNIITRSSVPASFLTHSLDSRKIPQEIFYTESYFFKLAGAMLPIIFRRGYFLGNVLRILGPYFLKDTSGRTTLILALKQMG